MLSCIKSFAGCDNCFFFIQQWGIKGIKSCAYFSLCCIMNTSRLSVKIMDAKHSNIVLSLSLFHCFVIVVVADWSYVGIKTVGIVSTNVSTTYDCLLLLPCPCSCKESQITQWEYDYLITKMMKIRNMGLYHNFDFLIHKWWWFGLLLHVIPWYHIKIVIVLMHSTVFECFFNICLKNHQAASINQSRDNFKRKQTPPLFDACIVLKKSTFNHGKSIIV